ncbi:MAG: VOC family protein [Planctomycetota bacterium]|jgi:lactoylglutathione lyase|nr:VOC family protein [Planctomycetota bacterium]MDP6941304.1 VOC family protein [Planctomycetota bacterium]
MKLAHTMIRVRNLEKSLEFYCGFLGLQEIRRKALGDEATLVFLSDENKNYFIELTFNHDQRDYELGSQFGHLAFVVSDLAPLIKTIEAKGWWYRQSKPEATTPYIFIRDPDGYDIEILGMAKLS